MDSRRVVKSLYEVDPNFVALCDTLFGPTVDSADVWSYLYDRDAVSKMSPAPSDVSVPTGVSKPSRGVLVPKPPMPKPAAVKTAPQPAPMAKKPASPVSSGTVVKSYDVVWSGEFSKLDSDKRQAFGWASVVEVDGQPVVDLQGDWITPDELERAAYTYVQKSRVGGTQHKRDEFGNAVKAGEMIESFVVTDEKIEKMGLPADTPRGWWVGYQYEEGDTWADIKAGRKTGFSVHGRGKRVEAEI
jgi:hypothetical protein